MWKCIIIAEAQGFLSPELQFVIAKQEEFRNVQKTAFLIFFPPF